MKQNNEQESDWLELSAQENCAIFASARNVPVFPLNFRHLFLLILMRNPQELGSAYRQRAQQFYNFAKDELQAPGYSKVLAI